MAKKNTTKRSTTLIIVESPTKAKTISKFVGSNFTVRSSFGHVRDLPKRVLGIDTANNFTPSYVVPLKAKTAVSALKREALRAGRVILATDEDREGEAIAWHLSQVLLAPPKKRKKKLGENPPENPDEVMRVLPAAIGGEPAAVSKIDRITFDEITKKAILEALEHPRVIDQSLVDAQQGRRILDRLVGYKLSPFLWKKISRGLSAGRVQSVALRLVVEREREREAFKAREYWTIEALLAKQESGIMKHELRSGEEPPEGAFIAKLVEIDGKKLDKFDIPNEAEAKRIADATHGATWNVAEVAQKEVRRNPMPPFTTSTLQQTAGRRFGFSAKQTMRLAQMLYEGMDVGEGPAGLITYMRTDSLNLSEESLQAARAYIGQAFGASYTEGAPRRYKTKSRTAQEAHEAIRPSDPARTPQAIQQYLEPAVWKLYNLIWRRFIASQMPPATFLETRVSILAAQSTFEARGLVRQFDGFQRVYPLKTAEALLPALAKDETVEFLELKNNQHFTEPPPRYNEARLIKTLEEFGIGRPSTYAPTMSVIQDRGYVQKDEKRCFAPTEVGYAVSDLLTQHFPLVVDTQFTAKMEEDLDKIASGALPWQSVVREFYEPFEKLLAEKHESIAKMVEETSEVCEKCGKPMVIRMGRFGKFLACSGFPECKNAKALPGSPSSASGQFPASSFETAQEAGNCEKCGAPLVERRGRFGPFTGCSKYPECDYIKKKNYAIGVKCPKCTEGDVVSRRTKSRRFFYGCSRYPACDYATWQRPTDVPAGASAKEGAPSEGGQRLSPDTLTKEKALNG